VFEAMLEGWALQQRTRFLKAATISSRLRLARRVTEFVNEYPWEWQSSDMEAFIDSCLNRAEPIVVSTARLYETTLRMFLQYVSDPATAGPANACSGSVWHRRRFCTSGTPSCMSPNTKGTRAGVR
jgi:hypothetical protein